MAFPEAVSTVISKARDRYADMSTTKALQYFNVAWRNLADAVDLRYKGQFITITAGTREYDIPADVIDVSSVYYMRTSDPTTWYPMYIKSRDELDLSRVGWRTATSQSEPFEFYIDTATDSTTSKAILGCVQIPNATSVAGYPCIGIFGQAITDMLSTDTLPAFVNVDQYFVASIKRQFAEGSDQANVGFWRDQEKEYLGELTRHIEQMGAHKGTRLIPAWCQRQTYAR